MRYFIDTEFIEYPHTIDLISIGIVNENGGEFYRESAEVDWSQANPWVLANVKPHLLGAPFVAGKQRIADDVLKFVDDDKEPEFWAYYGAYDWVVFCWLFGAMVDLPNGWPMFARDIEQYRQQLGSPALPEQLTQEHHTLADAKWTKKAWASLQALELKGVMDS